MSDVMTPYSTVVPFFVDEELWVPEFDRERIASYDTYDRIYWSNPNTFELSMRGTNDKPVYIPNARTVVNETAHYLLKDLGIAPEGDDPESAYGKWLTQWLKREEFYAKFHTAKLSGVVRGDWILHVTGDPLKPDGKRVSFNSVDPSQYFPITDPLDPDKIIGADLVDVFTDVEDNKTYIKRLRYMYVGEEEGMGTRSVSRKEEVLEVEGWWKGKGAKVKKTVLAEELLPEPIQTLPVYHFKNIDWQGQPFGSSELRGFEFLQSSINQTVSDEELALALDGLGVYATDAPQPSDNQGNPLPWEISPGIVIEVPTNNTLTRVQGVGTVTPMQDHLKFITDALYEGSSTFRTSQVDVQLAESGIALAMRFMPTLAKIQQRDWTGTALLEHFFFDLNFWFAAYETVNFVEKEVKITLGDKLPVNRVERLNELNNMLDRMVISRKYYRTEMEKLGYKFPDDMEKEVLAEQKALTEVRMFESPVNGAGPTNANGKSVPQNQSNNRNRPNESRGTEATQTPRQQQTQ